VPRAGTQIFLTFSPDRLARWYHPTALERLEALGDVLRNHRESILDTQELIAAADDCDVIVSDRATPVGGNLFGALSRLVAVVRCATDVQNIDVAAATAHGVLVTHASPGWVDSVAELVVGFMVSLGRGVPNATAAYRESRTPDLVMGRQLAGATLGVIGYGGIGRRVTELGRALRMRVLVNDPYVEEVAAEATKTGFDEMLGASDFVVCAAPASPQTERMMNAQAFERMKPTAYFINVARGQLVDEDALEFVLRTSRLAGAALDVGSAPDNLPALRLASLPNVIATPHIGGLVPEAIAHQALETADQVRDILAATMPVGALNAEHAWRLPADGSARRR
jgi:D-3-phosphoglycerate dehydrogenase / 2-oxoglutarate reductase